MIASPPGRIAPQLRPNGALVPLMSGHGISARGLRSMTFSRTASIGLLAAVVLTSSASCFSQEGQFVEQTLPPPSTHYPLGPDSLPHASVLTGKVFKFTLDNSKVFPGTSREIAVYIPAEYRAAKPACVYIGLDDLLFSAPTVFDNLIAQHAMPVVIAIGVPPGVVASGDPPSDPRFDRSFEFDSMTDRLARFLLEEVIPAVEQHRTPGGLPILLSSNPNDRAIGGASTGGIGAFSVAWERPDAFRRVFSAIGTYVGMRGGEQYYVLVRKTEPKPLRIFMQDGDYDEWPGGPEMGDWWMSNHTMERALEFAGYDVRHVWGTGTHDTSQASAVFPQAMRWLWKGWPASIKAEAPGNPVLKAVLQPESTWQHIATTCSLVTHFSANNSGQVFYRKGNSQRLFEVNLYARDQPRCSESGRNLPFALGRDGTVYLARPQAGIAVDHPHASGPATILPSLLRVRALTVRSNGSVYAATESPNGTGQLSLVRPGGKDVHLADLPMPASGLAFTPDGLWLFVTESQSRTGMSYRVRPDGTLDAGAPFYDFSAPDDANGSGASDVAYDREGRAYVATATGVQIFDRNGRVTAILPLPGNQAATAVCFGGSRFDVLYVAAGRQIYRRTLHVIGVPPWSASVGLPPGNAA